MKKGRPEKNVPPIWAIFWWLTVVDYDEEKKYWIVCECKCWKIKTFNKYRLIHWEISTCWCRWNVKKNSRHICDWIFNPNESKDDKRFHSIYLWIIRRCWRPWPREDVKNEWNSFAEFYNDMYPSYIEHIDKFWVKQTTIDRINPYWNYCRDNCRWATYSEQMLNRRWLSHYVIWWKTYRLSELRDITWITDRKIIDRYHKYIDGKITEEQMLYRWRIKWNHLVKAWPI